MAWKAKWLMAYLCVWCIGISRSMGQEKNDSVASEHQLDHVTVVARRLPHKVTSLAPVQLLSGSDIGRLGIRDMGDAVRRFAGANVRDYGGIGGLKTVSVRNMGAAHTAVSYDGVPVSNCQAGQIDIGRFSLDNVSTLSLSVGQADDLLQPARLYASAGVLSIETERPHFAAGQRSAFLLRMRGGSFGYVSPSLRWWQQLGSRTSLSIDGNFMRADGNYPFRLENGNQVTQERRNNSDIRSWQGEANLYHTFKDASSLQVKGYYYDSSRGLPGAVTLYNPYSDERLWDRNAFLQMRYQKQFSSQWSLQAQGKYNFGWNRYTDEGKEYTDGLYEAIHRQHEYYLSATALYRPMSFLSFSLAQDVAINTLSSTLPDCPFPLRYTLQTAFNARYQQGGLTVMAMLMHALLIETVETGDKPDNFRRLAPSVSLSWQPWESERLFFRLMYKSTFRTPTFNDLYYSRVGSRTLKPEKADEYNVGITWHRALSGFMNYCSLTADVYYNRVTDKIVAFPTTYAWRMANYGKASITGVDFTCATGLSLYEGYALSLSSGYTWQKAVDLTNPQAKNYKDQLPYTPRHSGNLSAILDTPWLHLGYSLIGMGERYFLSQNIPENRIDGYVEHSLSLSRAFRVKGCEMQLQAELNNLTDRQYDVIKYYPMPGRSWRLNAVFSF